MTIRTALAVAAAAALLATPLLAQDAKKASGSAQPFVNGAANGGMLEVQSSELANVKAQRPDVKSFANTLLKDHTKANEELKAAASKAGLQVPAQMDKKHQAELDKLKNAKAASFDKTFIDLQVEAHREAVGLFRNYAKSGDNRDLKAFAERTLPVLEQHQVRAKELRKGGSAATGGGSGTTTRVTK